MCAHILQYIFFFSLLFNHTSNEQRAKKLFNNSVIKSSITFKMQFKMIFVDINSFDAVVLWFWFRIFFFFALFWTTIIHVIERLWAHANDRSKFKWSLMSGKMCKKIIIIIARNESNEIDVGMWLWPSFVNDVCVQINKWTIYELILSLIGNCLNILPIVLIFTATVLQTPASIFVKLLPALSAMNGIKQMMNPACNAH